MTKAENIPGRKIILSGVVQGVGFRPFIYRHALSHRLNGWVRNVSGRVECHVQGPQQAMEAFTDTLLEASPDVSRPCVDSVEETASKAFNEFLILESHADADADIHLPADLFTCDDCLRELNDPENRRYRYPFINCTQCGPRYTLIESLPYDRPNTSMSGFPLCDDCHTEYVDPLNRRYHAEPVACETCGPVLSYSKTGQPPITGNAAALETTLNALRSGEIVAIKGIGGYHLVCDAQNKDAVARLRHTKPRPAKPLAVMFPAPPNEELNVLEKFLKPDRLESALLLSSARPIVLVRKNQDCSLAEGIAPGLDEVGAMLPYSPLHHLLLNDFNAPLVATSANISGEPVLTRNTQIEKRLAHVTSIFLHHNRPIVRPADDPVIRVINNQPAQMRQGRGQAPVEIELPFFLEKPVLAVGAQMKNTIALAWKNRTVVSPHIGEMESLRSLQTFEQSISDLQDLYQVQAEHIVCDAHTGFTASRWAHQQALPVSEVYHHHAHASAAYVDALSANSELEDLLVFTWDGVGLGPDGTLWGGEALLGSPGQWQRRAHIRPFKLPGGERAGREPWRSAAAICWESGHDCALVEASDPLLFSFWQQSINAPVTTAIGRLFDAASALSGVCSHASFEGQGPMLFETAAGRYDLGTAPVTELELSVKDDCYQADWQALIPALKDNTVSIAERAASFHKSMAHCLLNQAIGIRKDTGVNNVAFAGGVFQNRILTELAIALLKQNKFEITLPLLMPVNDAAISFGQIVDHGYGQS